ncbi:chemotaxis response regulator protein-glutamate methylesterase [Fulvivirgaceae bacterium PWU4]|uniref:Protein-glutamate methylesterase/protein-glutamine glutaminase n=1 Tax=Chryseosolibacter histidini TaxID=2782349 RepID=A0AAP2GQD9_9BACT|nr:chemotaxis response regulator protein-glutamate methylesterase [Chryseosolibacter histidini]MBT1698422.1 chemotaxis response regulator protein-glutamate methylesterase [Chryseosolibacter histidini]
MKKRIRVLICDDSALVRQTLTDIINTDPQLEVMSTAADPFFAAQKIKNEIPDVITLDIEMPRMDGLTFLKTLMAQYPIPVVIISSFTERGSDQALRALELGAIEIVGKSEIRNTAEHIEESRIRITDAIKAAYMAPVKRVALNRPAQEYTPAVKNKVDYASLHHATTTGKVIAIGASTGGTEALRFFLRNFPPGKPGIVITQHMPAGFTRSFAENVNLITEITVKEAEDGEPVLNSHAYIAPGGKHMEVVRNGLRYCIKICHGELVNRHKPSVDVLFNSVARHAGKNAVGILMTGMGKDGAEGLLHMKEAGAYTIAQDEKSCVVFGMPKEAIRINAAQQVLALQEMPKAILEHFH